LADARELEPLNPRLELLQRRLVAASNPPTQSARTAIATAPSAATIASTSDPSKVTTRNDELPDGALERFTR
jgi:hypothetical protein